MIAEATEPGATVRLVAHCHGAPPNQLDTWRRLAEQGAFAATPAAEEVGPAYAFRAQQEQIGELRRLLGKKALEVKSVKGALEIACRQKSRCCGRCLRNSLTAPKSAEADLRRRMTGWSPRSRPSSPTCRPLWLLWLRSRPGGAALQGPRRRASVGQPQARRSRHEGAR